MEEEKTKFSVVETEIVIPGVKREHKFLQFSDVHLAFREADSAPDDRVDPSSETIFEEVFEIGEKMKPELTIFSGDIIDYVSPATVRRIRRKLADYGGRFLYVQGNHDPGNDVVPSEGVQVQEFDDFIVAGISNGGSNISSAAIAELKGLCAMGKPIIMVQHVGVMTETNRETYEPFGSYFYISTEEKTPNRAEFARLERDDPSIVAVICGHNHKPYVSEIAKGKPQYCMDATRKGVYGTITVKGRPEDMK